MLQLLLLLGMALLHLLGLLLMLLLHLLLLRLLGLLLMRLLRLLRSGSVSLLLLKVLMLVLLLLLELLVFFLLLVVELLLLLLILLVLLGVPRIRRRRKLMWLYVFGVSRRRRRGLLAGRWRGRLLTGRGRGCRLTGRGFIRRASSGSIGVRLRRSPVGRRMIRRSGLFGGNDSGTVDGGWSFSSSYRRLALVGGGAQLRFRSGGLDMLRLGGYGWNVPLTRSGFFLRRRSDRDPAVPAVVAHAVFIDVGYLSVVDVVNIGDVHVIDCAVVIKPVMVPMSAFVAMAIIAKAISDSAVEPNLRPPIAVMEEEAAVVPSPVAGRPKKTNLWRFNPCARHPVIVAETRIVGPIAGNP